MKIKLLEIPNICSPMYRAAVPSDVLLPFKDIPFTENYCEGQSVKIDILIGLDFYWELVGTNFKTSNGLVAQETKFGWMLYGFWDNESKVMRGNAEHCLSMNCKTISQKIL